MTLTDQKYGEIDIHKETLPEEPAFVLRGKDKLAALTVRLYAAACRNAAAVSPASDEEANVADKLIEMAHDAEHAAARFDAFAVANADRVRLPD